MLQPGTDAPDFEVKDHTGARVRLSRYRGRPVVLWFYPSADTPLEACGFRDRISQFDARGVQVFGVSFGTVEENAAVAAKSGLNFPLLCDTDRAIGLAYGACDEPTAGNARRITCLIGSDGKIVKAYPKVDAATHAIEVLRDL